MRPRRAGGGGGGQPPPNTSGTDGKPWTTRDGTGGAADALWLDALGGCQRLQKGDALAVRPSFTFPRTAAGTTGEHCERGAKRDGTRVRCVSRALCRVAMRRAACGVLLLCCCCCAASALFCSGWRSVWPPSLSRVLSRPLLLSFRSISLSYFALSPKPA